MSRRPETTVYQRAQFQFPRLTRVIKTLIISLTVAYVVELILQNIVKFPIFQLLSLEPSAPLPWQLLTFIAVDHPGSPFGFLIGMLFLWLIASPFEKAFGPRRTIQMCLACGLAGSVSASMLGMAVPASPSLYGAHVLSYGIMAGHAYTMQGRRMSLFGLGSMTSNQFLLLLVGLSVLMYLASLNHTQLVASLGAMAGGIGYIRWLQQPRSPKPPRRRKKSGGFRVIKGGKDGKDGDKGEDEPPQWLN